MDSHRIVKVVVPAPVEPPRGADWAASAVVWVWQRLRHVAKRRRPIEPAQHIRRVNCGARFAPSAI